MSTPSFDRPKIAQVTFDLWTPRVVFELACRVHVLCQARVTCDFSTRASLLASIADFRAVAFVVSSMSLNKPGKKWEQQAHDALRATLTPERALELLRDRTLEAIASCETKVPEWLLNECANACAVSLRNKTHELERMQTCVIELQRDISALSKLEIAARQSAAERASAAKARQEELLRRASGLWRLMPPQDDVTFESQAKLGPTGGLFARIDSACVLTIGEEFTSDGEQQRVTFFSAKFTDKQSAMTTLGLWCK